MKKRFAVILLVISMITVLAVGFSACGEITVKAIGFKDNKAPVVISAYSEDLAIADDCILLVKDDKGEITEHKVTLDMIDQTGFDKNSTEEQTLKVVYGGKSKSFSFTLQRIVSEISVKTAPKCTSVVGEPFTIDNSGVLEVTFKDGGKEDVNITSDMVDMTSVDQNSPEEQDVRVVYEGKSATFKITIEHVDDTGEETTVRFEAEDADYGGVGNVAMDPNAAVGVEACGGQTIPGTDAPDSCVKNLFLGRGGYITFTVESSKTSHAYIGLSVGFAFDQHPNMDDFMRIEVNGNSVATGLTYDAGKPTYGSSWWVFQDYEMAVPVVLKKGTNTISIRTYGYAGLAQYADESAPLDASQQAGGRNISHISLRTTATVTHTKVQH